MKKCNNIAFLGGNLIIGNGTGIINNSIILIKSGKIEKVLFGEKIDIPNEYRIYNIHDKTIMPGLIDLHVHLCLGASDICVPGDLINPLLSKSMTMIGIKGFARARRAFEMGFTTLRDAGDEGFLSVALRDAINSNIVEGPRIVASGKLLTTTGGHFDLMPPWLERNDDSTNIVDGSNDVLKKVRQQLKMKTDWIKFAATGGIMDSNNKKEFTDEEMKIIISESHNKGKLVCAHCMHLEGTLTAVKAGLDTVEHGSQLNDEIIDLMLEKGTTLVPTLYAPDANVFHGKDFGLPQRYIDKCRLVLEHHIDSFKLAHKSGVNIALGTDCGYTPCPHGTNAKELELLVKYGMTPMEALMAATKYAAEALRIADQIGTIETNKLADIIVIDGNPLDNIAVLKEKRKIVMVMREGEFFVNKL